MNIRKNRSIFSILFILFIAGIGYFLSINPSDNLKLYIIPSVLGIPFLWSIFEIVKPINNSKAKRFLIFSALLLASGLIPSTYFLLKHFLSLDKSKLALSWFASSAAIGIIFWLCSHKYVYIESFLKDNLKSVAFFRLCAAFIAFWSSLSFLFLFISDWKWSIFILALPFISDTIAYLFGRLGTAKVFSSSPNKTLLGFICPLVFIPLISYFVFMFVLKPNLNDRYIWIGLTVAFALSANIGDLYFSSQKRLLGIKDYSRVFLGHGGFWDRFDSHTFTLSLFIFLQVCFNIIPNNSTP